MATSFIILNEQTRKLFDIVEKLTPPSFKTLFLSFFTVFTEKNPTYCH